MALLLFPDKIRKKKINFQVQRSIGVKVQERKRKYEDDNKNPAISKAVWNAKRRKWAFTQRDYIQPAVSEVFKNLTDEPRILKAQQSLFVAVYRKVNLTLKKIVAKTSIVSWVLTQRKKKALKEKYDMLYLIFLLTLDIRQHILLSKAKQLYEEYCVLKAEAGEEPEKLIITRKWL